jgi:hypothetical protein
MKPPRSVKPLARYMRRKPLTGGLWGYFFEPPTWARRTGCPVAAEPLGQVTEHDAALDIAKGIWLKRRFQLFLMVEAEKNARNPDHPSYDERTGFLGFLTHAKMFHEDAFSHASHFLPKGLLEGLVKQYPKTNFKPETEWFAAVEKGITSSLLPMYDSLYSESETYRTLMNSAATFSGDLFERAIALDERLNAMIDRATKRLIQIKAMKQVLGHAPKKPKGEVIKLPERKSSVR